MGLEETPIAIPETYELIYVNLFFPTGAMPGVVNFDESIDILDIIRIVNIALGIGDPPTDHELWAGDMNSNNELNVLDIVVLINIILENGISLDYSPQSSSQRDLHETKNAEI